jgi:hypothetical protein
MNHGSINGKPLKVVKKTLIDQSLKGAVDLSHYNAQGEDDLKRIYDRVNISVLV